MEYYKVPNQSGLLLMFLKSSKGNINLSILLFTFLICIAIALGVAFFHHYNTPNKFLEYKVADVSDQISGVSNFPATANRILNADNSVSYIKLLDRNGVIEESFGNDSLSNTKRFTINGPGNKTIVLGLKPPSNSELDTYLLVWSLLIGSALSLFLIFIVFMRDPKTSGISTDSMSRLEGAMDKISAGDYGERLDVSSSASEDISILNTYQSFNRMAENLNTKYGPDEDMEADPVTFNEESEHMHSELSNGAGNNYPEETEEETEVVLMNETETGPEAEEEKPGILFEDVNGNPDLPETTNEEAEFDLGSGMEDEQIFSNQEKDDIRDIEEDLHETQQGSEQELTEVVPESGPGEEVSAFKPKIVLPQEGVYPKNRNVTVVVAKIDDFENLTEKLESSDLSMFLTQYRKSASQIISGYGGVIEALLQDEIVAIFNAPDEQNNPELRAICASVEVLHELATMAKARRAEGKEMIAGKIGVGVQSLAYYSETGVPDSVKNVIKDARYVCENANLWKVYVTSELHDIVKENVDAKEYEIEGEVLYSITGVEQGVVERDDFS